MAVSQEDLASTLGRLKRSPAPKPPVISPQSPVGLGAIDLGSVHLRKTGKRESLIAEDMDRDKENELSSVFAKRKMFDQGSEKAVTLPRIAPKPNRKVSDGDTRRSSSGSASENSMDNNSNILKGSGAPTLRPLPTLQSIGRNPPAKPNKPPILSLKLKKYKNHQVILSPKIKEVIAEEVKNGTCDQVADAIDDDVIEEDIYDDINTGIPEPIRPPKPSIPPPTPQIEPEPITEDTYDDVEQLAETVKLQLASQSTQPHIPSFHVENDEGVEFGDDLYDPIQGTFSIEQTNDIEPEDMEDGEQHPEPSKEDPKTKKEKEKKERELQKKKEREELKRKKEEEKREREDKKKREEEKKRREKLDKELKKTHKLKGNEEILGKGTTKEDIAGNGKDLSCTMGTHLEVILQENCPQGKWLVRDQQGHYGYISSENLLLETGPEDASLDEDLYECVETFQGQTAPPTVPPPQPPAGVPDFPDELYDDTLVEDEDFYDDIPGAN